MKKSYVRFWWVFDLAAILFLLFNVFGGVLVTFLYAIGFFIRFIWLLLLRKQSKYYRDQATTQGRSIWPKNVVYIMSRFSYYAASSVSIIFLVISVGISVVLALFSGADANHLFSYEVKKLLIPISIPFLLIGILMALISTIFYIRRVFTLAPKKAQVMQG